VALPTYDKKDLIPKGFEEEYEEKDGKFVPIDRSAALTKALAEERKAREAAEATARKAAKEAAEAAAKAAGEKAGLSSTELEAGYRRVREAAEQERDLALKERDEARSENRRIKLVEVVKSEFRKHGALDKRTEDFWKMHGDEFDLTADGKPMVKAEPGKPLDKHVQSILKQRPEWVQGTKAAGGGAGGTTSPSLTSGGSGPGGKVTFEDLVKNPATAIAQANES
jgi:hypothetical protein